jgi:CO/xanthine dehydrogenase FAD-binding subunit
MQEFDFLRPRNLGELSTALRQGGCRIIAGGTDVIPRMRRDQLSASMVIDISDLEDLRGITQDGDWISIGALTTHRQILQAPLLQKHNPALVAAAASIGCDQTRNRGTLGGNIANASPAGDTIPPLLVFDAEVALNGPEVRRTLPLEEFITGPGETRMQTDEFIHSLKFRKLSGAWGAAFEKLGKRSGMAISVANAAAAVVLNSKGRIEHARLALGSVAPVVLRCADAEAFLSGRVPTQETLQEAANLCASGISPISDVRATADYRRYAAVVLARRALQAAVDRARSGTP